MKILILIITAFISLQLSASTTTTLSQMSEVEQPKLNACKRKCGCLCPAKPPPEKKNADETKKPKS